MELSRIILRRRTNRIISIIMMLGMLASLTGCGKESEEGSEHEIRSFFQLFEYYFDPAANQEQMMRVDVGSIVYDFSDSKQNPYSGDGGEIGPWASGSTGSANPIDSEVPIVPGASSTIIDPSRFSPTSTIFVSAKWYTKYLREKVYNPINEILRKLPTEDRNNVYFRVYHVGYDYDSSNRSCKQGTLFSQSSLGTLQRVGGLSMPTFVQQWLGQLDTNANVEKSTRSATSSLASYYARYDDKDWLFLSDPENGLMFNADMLRMLGNERTGFKTFKDYRDELANPNGETLGVVPNMYYKCYTAPTSTTTITLNNCVSYAVYNKTSPNRYIDQMSTADLTKVFSKYNQFMTRSCPEPIDTVYSDDSSILMAYLDGYNKTLIYMGTAPGENLADVLGDNASEIINTISSAYSVTDWMNILALYPDADYVPAGTLGEN